MKCHRYYYLIVFITLLLNTTLPSSLWASVPPWHDLHSLLKATLGLNECTEIGDLQEPSVSETNGLYKVDITVCTKVKAQALATLLAQSQIFVDRKVLPTVYYRGTHQVIPPQILDSSDLVAVQKTVESALKYHPFFVQVHQKGTFIYSLTVEFTPSIVQYWADNMGDLYGNINMVASEAFTRVLGFQSGALKRVTTTLSNEQY